MTTTNFETKTYKTMGDYYPENSVLFYGYPAGDSDGFYNAVPPWIEELVSARLLTCTETRDNIRVLVFDASSKPDTLAFLREDLGVSILSNENIIRLSPKISSDVKGQERNQMIRKELIELVPKKSLIMAQPFQGEDVEPLYAIPSKLTTFLNDKINMPEIFGEARLAERYKIYENGADFYNDDMVFPIPCVVKVSSSSSGDGVRIPKTKGALQEVKGEFRNVSGKIIIEEYIDAKYNLGIQMVIPADKSKYVDILATSFQLTNNQGEYLGNITEKWTPCPSGKRYEKVMPIWQGWLERIILPKIRERGWYGVLTIDILTDGKTNDTIIDPNFRFSANTPFVFKSRNDPWEAPSLASFTGIFKGSRSKFRNIMRNIARIGRNGQIFSLVAMVENEGSCNVNGAVLFDQDETLRENARDLIKMGFQSSTLTSFAKV